MTHNFLKAILLKLLLQLNFPLQVDILLNHSPIKSIIDALLQTHLTFFLASSSNLHSSPHTTPRRVKILKAKPNPPLLPCARLALKRLGSLLAKEKHDLV